MWAAVIIGLLVGAVVGFAVYQGSRLEGQSLFVLCGTTAGGVAAVVIY
jgi:high-affinity Fe2+/Pb2+ permease